MHHILQINEGKYRKLQRFVFRNGIALEEDSDDKIPKVPIANRLLQNDMLKYNPVPVLTFGAFYRDPLGEGYKSTTRFRTCNVLYFLDDDEIKIYEPPQKNSGLPQCCIVGKGKLKKPEGDFYTINDLNIGESLFVNGKEFKLINCDAFTRRFMTEMGYKIGPPEPNVYDPITEDRIEANTPRSYRRPYIKEYKVAPFLKHDPKQLRFYGEYGDDKNLFEEKRECTLYYDLAKGTIKMVEDRKTNKWIGGRFDTRILLQPTRGPKAFVPALTLGETADPTLLNLAHDVKDMLIGGKYYKVQNLHSVLVDGNPLEGRKRTIEYYKDTDLQLGVPLNLLGFRVVLYDCDEFTKNYFRGIHDIEIKPVPRKDGEICHVHKLVYRHEEFGVPEQTLRTNEPFLPKKYNADVLKFFQNSS
ncbi:EF-hand domain-containing family member C2 [Caerostris darwini]|uniref:EF-hand domain-containing family member C2 n=1 Tax=Caerostris darwini TaxID=1538125 RepID=A0AAV4W749_9ARAC|nr:EF-hand domain-containing family member C2 [Caerostris darwini]